MLFLYSVEGKLPDIDGEVKTGESVCESCGATFFCAVETGECWCFAVDVKPEKLNELRENFSRCLCQSCLAGEPKN